MLADSARLLFLEQLLQGASASIEGLTTTLQQSTELRSAILANRADRTQAYESPPA